MSVVYKYAIDRGPGLKTFTREMPAGAQIVRVGATLGTPVFWALCDEGQPKESRRFIAVMTGETFHGAYEYVGTSVLADGAFVLHLFEVPS